VRSSHPSGHALNFSWLTRLRWGAIAGQLCTIAGVERFMDVALPLAPLLAIVALEVAVNLACLGWSRGSRRAGPASEWPLVALMAFDVLVLTALLYYTGGPNNPFSFLYLVEISLAAVLLRARWTWSLVVLSLVCSAVLFGDHVPLVSAARSHAEHMELHLWGMWVAFGVAAAFIVWFLLRIVRALSRRDAELQAAHAHQERLRSLATLAGGAAHELATPLGTIAVAARELERRVPAGNDVLAEDIRLIRSQVERCREILDHMAAQSGTGAGEALDAVSLGELVAVVVKEGLERPPVRLDLDGTARDAELRAPRRALTLALRGLVKNAQDASPPEAEVVVRATVDQGNARIEIADRGAGMSAETLARAGEPFFTTKAPGRGMGLGLFLARAIVEQAGGALALDSAPGRGTSAIVTLPATIRRIAMS